MTDPHLPRTPRSAASDSQSERAKHTDSQRLLRALRVAVPVESPQHVQQRRTALISVIAQQIEKTPRMIVQQERRGRQLKLLLTAAAVALVSLSSVWLWTRHTFSGEVARLGEEISGPGVAEGQASVVLVEGQQSRRQTMITGQELDLHGAQSLRGELPGHTKISVKPASASKRARVKLDHLAVVDQSLFISEGELWVDVPEGRLERRHVMVVTPDAKVEVKGTQFSVSVEDVGGGSRTTVRVRRGRVLVTWLGGQKLLAPGDSWTSSEPGPLAAKLNGSPASESAVHPSEREEKPEGQTAVSSERKISFEKTAPHSAPEVPDALVTASKTAPSKTAPHPDLASTLAEQNRLLERAVRAQQQGATDRAIELFDTLIQTYPDSPLRSIAASERRRLASEKR